MIEKVWDSSRFNDALQLRAIALRRPLSCMLELTYRCNFRCRMCYVRMSDAQAARFGRMRTAEEWLDMARQLRDAGVLYLTLTGGECTLYPGFDALYQELSRMGFIISILSNAAAYTESVRSVFRRYPPRHVSVTLYGGSNETYEAVTGDPNGFDNTLAGIRFLRSIGVPVALNFTVIRTNALDYPLVNALCRELGIPYTLATDVTAHRHDPTFSEALTCRLSPAQRACLACHPPEEAALALSNAEALEREAADFQLPAAPAEPLPPEQDSCIGSCTACAILWNGEMQTCISMGGWDSVRPFEIGFEAAWARMKALQAETFRRPAACQACEMAPDCIHNCAGRRHEGTGTPHRPDPYTCRYTHLLRLYRARHTAVESPPAPPCA